MKEIFPEHISTRKPPRNIIINDIPLFEHEFSKIIRATNIEWINGADILKDTVFDRSKFKFLTSHTHLAGISFKGKIKRLLLFLCGSIEIEKGIWITDNNSHYYFHWLTDALPRLIAAERFTDGHKVILPSIYKNLNFVRQSLQILQIEAEFVKSLKKLHVKNLIIAGHTASTGNYNKEVVNRLRERFSVGKNVMPSRKVFISREKAIRRKITNEHEVVKLLQLHGFEIHCFEDYSFSEQIKIMQEVKYLAGLHGAGLANMVFMSENGKILELRNRNDDHNNCYFSLASDLGHDYYYMLNEGNSSNTFTVDVTVDLAKLTEILKIMAL